LSDLAFNMISTNLLSAHLNAVIRAPCNAVMGMKVVH